MQQSREKTSFLIKDILNLPANQHTTAAAEHMNFFTTELIQKPTPVKMESFSRFPAELLLLREGMSLSQ